MAAVAVAAGGGAGAGASTRKVGRGDGGGGETEGAGADHKRACSLMAFLNLSRQVSVVGTRVRRWYQRPGCLRLFPGDQLIAVTSRPTFSLWSETTVCVSAHRHTVRYLRSYE